MGLFARLFKKDKVDLSTNTNFIMTGKIFIYKPNEDFYHENKNEIKTYEKVYLSKLNQNKTLTSLDLKLEDDKYLHHYINKLTKINLEIDFIIDPLNQSDKKEYTYLSILEEKQKLYHTLIVNHINNLFLKKAALENILKRSPFMSMNKKNTIKNLISQIEIQIISMQNAITGNLLEITTLKGRIASLNLPKKENEETLNRYKKIIESFDINLSEITPVNIAKATVQVEDELYNNKSLVSKLNEELSALIDSKLPPREILTKLDKLIAKCIGIEELNDQKLTTLKEKLINAKYNILCTLAVNNNYQGISFNDFFKEEKGYLETILLSQINNITKDPNSKIYNSYKEASQKNSGTMRINEYERLVRLLKQIITNDSGEFSTKDIFDIPFKLALITSISSPKLITKFFDNYMVNSSDIYKYIINQETFELVNQIPLSTFVGLLSDEVEVTKSKKKPKFVAYLKSSDAKDIVSNQKLFSLVQLYTLIFKTILNTKTNKEIPNGIKNINSYYMTFIEPVAIYYGEIFMPFLERLKLAKTPIEFPSSLNKVNLNAFSKMCYETTHNDLVNPDLKLKFNEGTKEIVSTKEIQFDTIQFPSTISGLRLLNTPANWVFNNYLNCEALETKDGILKLLKDVDMSDAFSYQKSKFHFKHALDIFSFTIDTERIPPYNNIDARDYSHEDYILQIYKSFKTKIKEICHKIINYAKTLGIERNSKIKFTYTNSTLRELYKYVIKQATSMNLPTKIKNEYDIIFQEYQNHATSVHELNKVFRKIEALANLGLISNGEFKAIAEKHFDVIINNYESGSIPFYGFSLMTTELISEIMANKISSSKSLSYENIDQEELLRKKLTNRAINRREAVKLEETFKTIFNDEHAINDRILLELLSALYYKNPLEKIIELLHTIKIDKGFYSDLLKEIYREKYFCDKIPLHTMLILIDHLPANKRNSLVGKQLNNIYNFYKILSNSLLDDPQEIILSGIKAFELNNYYYDIFTEITVERFDKFSPKTLLFPKDLEEIILSGVKIVKNYERPTVSKMVNKIVLNEEIKYLEIKQSFSFEPNLAIEIPAELKKFPKHRINHRKNVSIVFKDYENSKILNNQATLRDFVEQYIENIIFNGGFGGESIKIVLAKSNGEQIIIKNSYITDINSFCKQKYHNKTINNISREINKYLPPKKVLVPIKNKK